MAIDPLQLRSATFPTETGRRNAKAGSAFDALLEAAGKGEAPGAARAAALELMRVEMMQSSLALSGEAEPPPPSGVRALQALFCAVAGTGRPAGTPAGGKAAGPSAATADAAATEVEAGAMADGIGKTAAEFLGTPYRFGGEAADGIDCSSFVQKVFREHDIALPRTAREQIRAGSEVAQGDLKKGDLVFFHTYASYPSHVGIYLGDGKMIHASSARGEVAVSDINSDYYRSRFIGARRVG